MRLRSGTSGCGVSSPPLRSRFSKMLYRARSPGIRAHLRRLKATRFFWAALKLTVSCSAHDGFAATTRERTRSESAFGTTWSLSRNSML
jgi:hypothetical protein